MAAILRATNEAGETYDDPSEGRLRDLIEALGAENSFLIVERLEPGRAGHFMQTVMGPEGAPWILEYREGAQETHHSTSLESSRAVHDVLTGWAFDLPGWRDGLTWTPVRS